MSPKRSFESTKFLQISNFVDLRDGWHLQRGDEKSPLKLTVYMEPTGVNANPHALICVGFLAL